MPIRAVFIALLATLGLAGCGETTIDAAKGETFIKGVVTKQIGAKVKSVACPDDVKAKKGDMFKCQVVGPDGSTGEVDVRQADDEGNVKVDAPFLHVREAEQVIDDQVSKSAKAAVTVRCQEIVVVKQGGRFPCTATIGGEDLDLAVTLTDDKGNFTYRAAKS